MKAIQAYTSTKTVHSFCRKTLKKLGIVFITVIHVLDNCKISAKQKSLCLINHN